MRIAIYDKGGGGFEQRAESGAIAVFGRQSVEILNVPSGEAVVRMRAYSHIVCHLRSDDPDRTRVGGAYWASLIECDLSRVEAIIRVSSQGAEGMRDSYSRPYKHEKGPWILHLLEPSGALQVERWKTIFMAFKNWNGRSLRLPDELSEIFVAGSGGDRVALRLLCEAWLASEELSGRSDVGVTMVAPNDGGAWLKPFGEECSEAAAMRVATKVCGDGVSCSVAMRVFEAALEGRLAGSDGRNRVEALRAALR